MKKILLAAMLIATPAFAEDEGSKQAIVPEGFEWAVEEFQFSPAVRAGDFVFLSGIVANLDPDMDEVDAVVPASEENLQRSYRNAFNTIGTVLTASGASWEDVVEMTSYHTELRAQGAAFMAVKAEFLKEPFHAWTAIDVDRLWPDNGVTEIKIVAYAPVK